MVFLQSAQIKQGREKEKLKIVHDKQLDELTHDVQKVLDNHIVPRKEITSIETVL